MKFHLSLIVFLFPVLCFAQEQISDIYSLEYQEKYEQILTGYLEGEPITLFVDGVRVFVDFENDEISDYAISYTYSFCFSNEEIKLEGKHLYFFGKSAFVIDLKAKIAYDHINYGVGLSYINAESYEGGMIFLLANSENDAFYFVRYDVDTKQNIISTSHHQIFTYKGGFYFIDASVDKIIVGKMDPQDGTETELYQGEILNYVGDGYFQDQEGYLIEGLLESNFTKKCQPYDVNENELIINRYYDRENFSMIETYDSELSIYSYYLDDGCNYRKYFSEDDNPLNFDFYNERNFGFRSNGNLYKRYRHVEETSQNYKFVNTSNKTSYASDHWMMQGDTAYFFRDRVTTTYDYIISRYTPNLEGVLGLDNVKGIKTFHDVSVVFENINSGGDIELTATNMEDGVYRITIDPEGNQIDQKQLFFPWYYHKTEDRIPWSSFDNGYLKKNRLKPSDNYRVDRFENGQVTSSIMLTTPYIDKDIEVSIIESFGSKYVRFNDVNSGVEKEVENSNLDLDYYSQIIRVNNEIWVVTSRSYIALDRISKYSLEGDYLGKLDINMHRIIHHDDNGLLFINMNDQYEAHLFHYDGGKIKQLTNDPDAFEGGINAKNIIVGNKHHILISSTAIVSYSTDIALYEYSSDLVSITLLEEFIGAALGNSSGIHNSLQLNKSISIFEDDYYSNSIKHILFHSDGYSIEEFDFDESTFVNRNNSFAYKNGFIYSVQDNMTNAYVASNGVVSDIIVDIDGGFLINDIQQMDEHVYLFGGNYNENYVIKCDSEFNECEVVKSFQLGCWISHIVLLGKHNDKIYFSAVGRNPSDVIWTLDTSSDEVYLYNTDEESKIRFFIKREFIHDGYVYFKASREDKNYQLFRIEISEEPVLVEEGATDNEFDIYPNITTGDGWITTKTKLSGITIFDSGGRKVGFRKFDKQGGFTLPNLINGYYIIRGENNTGNQYLTKLVVIN